VAKQEAWWRPYRAGLVTAELDAAVQLLARFPAAGTPYVYPRRPGVRRLYLAPIGGHLYYTLEGDDVVIRAWWGAKRGRGPRL